MVPIGIPYAPTDPDTLNRVCPVCEKQIVERYDRAGERVTNNYAAHYMEAHSHE